jgi:hypothetical protein
MKLALLIVIVTAIFMACGTKPVGDQARPQAKATASNKLTSADIAKLKWLEGTWRGMDGEKPFFERYRFENGTAMVVETLEDETLSKVTETSRFELKDGEFGHTEGKQRSAASYITDTAVQFVPVEGGGNRFRFERNDDGTGWRAVLDLLPSAADPAPTKIYNMEPWPKK